MLPLSDAPCQKHSHILTVMSYQGIFIELWEKFPITSYIEVSNACIISFITI